MKLIVDYKAKKKKENLNLFNLFNNKKDTFLCD